MQAAADPIRRPAAGDRGGRGRTDNLQGWVFVAPALALVGLFMIYPILSSLWMSLQVGQGMNLHFGGIANIRRLVGDPVFLHALGNTTTYFFVQVPICAL